jgi:hypothetical protein
LTDSRGADAKLLATYTEVESGRRNDRPELLMAMDRAKLTGSTLLIVKPPQPSPPNASWRLARNDPAMFAAVRAQLACSEQICP